jgi:hypothetical protein
MPTSYHAFDQWSLWTTTTDDTDRLGASQEIQYQPQALPSIDVNTNIDSNIFESRRLIPLNSTHLKIAPQDLKLQYYSGIDEKTLIHLAEYGNRHVELLIKLHSIAAVHYYGPVYAGQRVWWDINEDRQTQKDRKDMILKYEERWELPECYRARWILPPAYSTGETKGSICQVS